MILDKLFKKISANSPEKKEVIERKTNPATKVQEKISSFSSSAPEISYVHTSQNRGHTIDRENNVLVLDWIAKKKKGYAKESKYPKWFLNTYGIDFEHVMANYINQGLLSEENNVVRITPEGQKKIKEYDYVIFVHEHPQYCLTIADFTNAQNLHKVQLNDIVWSVFNARILKYTQNRMWNSLAANYANMADLLIEEEKYDQALDFIFATAFLETSGMRDNNELTPIFTEFTKKGWTKKYLDNGMPDIFLLEINNYYVTVPFKKVEDSIHLDWFELQQRYLNSRQIAALENILPFRYFEKTESFEIFKQAVEADGKKGIFRLADCTCRLKWNTPNEHSAAYFYASTENKVAQTYRK